ncbi:MAG: exonuclease domain-containing protein [Candidatus Omnitrophica bacterium]|nr:exonuclease domain-containing protein [Candidatus Omnitrophota bacterium]MDD5027701.1 exonuclease domain-containing protein [Candidatus Omnitrophota bacterium]MDD5661604.1 exonuclease domain-containing protein [Candidatus Omnitrophota bacterium]
MMNKNIDEIEFVIFDTETTGLEPASGDRIVELAALRFRGVKRISEFQTLVNSGQAVSAAAFAVNKISPEMLQGAPSPARVLPKFMDFIQDSCLCSYNAGFDLDFLNNELRILKISALKDIFVVDILKMARRIVPGLERYALWFVADKLGIKTQQEHRAFSDVELTLGVFYKLLAMLKAKGIVDFNKFLGLFSIDPLFLQNVIAQKITRIQEALSLGVKIKIEYLSSSSAQLTERQVLPKEIREENGRMYLVGYCCLRKEERSFRIDSILHIEIVNER